MLSYRVVRKIQADLLLVEMAHSKSNLSSSPSHNNNHNRNSGGFGAGHTNDDSIGNGSQAQHDEEEKLLRIIPLPEKLISLPETDSPAPNRVPGPDATGEAFTPRGLTVYDLIPRPKDRLLKELVAFRSIAARKPSSFVSLEHVSLQQPPATGQAASPKTFMASSPTAAQPPAQLHLFQDTTSICGQGRYSLKFARPYLSDENISGSGDELLWRLLSELSSALHIFHFTLRDTETTENVEGKCFFTYYGQLLDANVFVAFRDDNGELRTAQEMASILLQRADESTKAGAHLHGPFGSGSTGGDLSFNNSIQEGNRVGGAGKHFPAWELQVAVDLPTSILYRAVPKNTKEERRHSFQWAAEDIRAAAEVVLSCMEVKSDLHGSPTAADAASKNRFSQELRFLLSKMTAPDPRQRPTAAQIINFQAVALRRRNWKLQATNHELQWTIDSLRRQLNMVQDDNVKLSEHLSQQRPIHAAVSLSPRTAFKAPDESILERERLAMEREKKISVFLHLYNLTADQLDALPATVDPVQVQSYQQHLSSTSPSASRVRQEDGARRSTESSKHSPLRSGEQRQGSGQQPVRRSGSYTPPPDEYFDPHGHDHRTPERDEAKGGRMPDSPELSPLPKASDYGSEVDDSGAYGGGGGRRPGTGASADDRDRLGEDYASKRSSQTRGSQALNFFDLVAAPAPTAGVTGETGFGRSNTGVSRDASSSRGQSRDGLSEQRSLERRETTPGSNAMRRPLPFAHAQTGPVHVPLEDARMVLEHQVSPVALPEIGECEIIELDEGDSPTERNIFPGRGDSALRNSLRPGTHVFMEGHHPDRVEGSNSYRGQEELPTASLARNDKQPGWRAMEETDSTRASDLGPTPSRASLLQQQRALNRMQQGVQHPQPSLYRDATLLPPTQIPYSTPVKETGTSDDPLQGTPNTARGSSAPPSERKGRSPSSTKERNENQKWMTSLLNDLESMRKELHDASSASVPSVVGGVGVHPGPVAASMLQLVSQDVESGAALTELRSRVPKSQLQPLAVPVASPQPNARGGPYPQSTFNLGLQGHSIAGGPATAAKPQPQLHGPTVLPAIQGSTGKRFFATPGIPSASGSSSPRGHLKPNYQLAVGAAHRSKLP